MGRCLFHWEIHRRAPRGQEVGAVSRRVAALCHEILAAGKCFCTLFADVENPTVNGIYQRLGFEPLGEFVELDFE